MSSLIPRFCRSPKHQNCFGVARLHLVLNGGDLAIDFLRELSVDLNKRIYVRWIHRAQCASDALIQLTRVKHSVQWFHAYMYYIRFSSGLKHWRNNDSARLVSWVHTPRNCGQNSHRKGKSTFCVGFQSPCNRMACLQISLLCWCGELNVLFCLATLALQTSLN